MTKKIAILLFVATLAISVVSPQNEAVFDKYSSSVEYAQAETNGVYASAGMMPGMMPQGGATTMQNSADMNNGYMTMEGQPVVQSDDVLDLVDEVVPEITPAPYVTPAPTPLVKGMKNSDVILLQKQLSKLGFLAVSPDGDYGNATVDAVNLAKRYINEMDGKAEFSEDGMANAEFLDRIYSVNFDDNIAVMASTSSNALVKRVQSKLNQLNYLYDGIDGRLGGETTEAIQFFQKVNGMSASGSLDAATLQILFGDNALENTRPVHLYKITVDISEQRVYVYKWNDNDNDYTTLANKFICSTGTNSTPTPTGVYTTSVKKGDEWHHFSSYNCWAQYAIHIDETGNIMFHSVIFNKKGGKASSGSVSALGHKASHGCVRLAVKDAKWLWETINNGTTVIIQK